MSDSVLAPLYSALGVGVEAPHLTIFQVVIKAVVIFMATLLLVRIADKRFFAKKTAFDLILGFILASMMARAINGSEQLGPTIVAGFVLVMLHRLLAWLSCKSKTIGGWVKGHSQTLVEDGVIDRDRLAKHHISEDDLNEAVRLKGLDRPEHAKLARLERSGEISVVK